MLTCDILVRYMMWVTMINVGLRDWQWAQQSVFCRWFILNIFIDFIGLNNILWSKFQTVYTYYMIGSCIHLDFIHLFLAQMCMQSIPNILVALIKF